MFMPMFLLPLAALLASQFICGVQSLSVPPTHKLNRREYLHATLGNALAVTTPFLPIPVIANAIAIVGDDEGQGIAAITDSRVGRAFRKSIVKGAQVADKLDEKWERFSDSLRDRSKCDPNTGRRLYDNGKRKDGTPIGNPGLGELCSPEPLLPLDVGMTESILDAAVKGALAVSWEKSPYKADILHKTIQDTKDLVRPSFERSMQNSMSEDERNRGFFKFNSYATLRAISIFLTGEKSSYRDFQVAWGDELLSNYAPTASRNDFVSPFPKGEDEFQDFDYDKYALLNALGKLTVTLNRLKAGGFLSYYEISIPYDDYGSVVTVALDDYAIIGAEILLSEQKYSCEGPMQALVRALFDKAGINCSLDTFYIDPSTTRQDDYNPTQLLLSLNGLRRM
ncbi:hypothetical protein ACHAXA_010704 [Cyclostephanos tholiformis]|uniref:Uncharacterized protein n=1 Tax=Cyclostephanos tholiformis TaxID=382380 RepID=A0ABD3SEE0_9STRA